MRAYRKISSKKQEPRKTLLAGLHNQVRSRFREYRRLGVNLEALTELPWSDADSEALLHCYVGSTTPLEILKADILALHSAQFKHNASQCPYCCLVARRSTFDHYVPKEDFPEFAAFIYNLVPCCKDCNTLKGSAWKSAAGGRTTLHFYVDQLPMTQFLFADAEVGTSLQVQFRLSGNSADFGGIESAIRRHFSSLNLLERYQEAAPEEFSSYEGVVSGSGLSATQHMLLEQAASMAERFSPNHWKVALYQAMAANPAFLQQL